MTDFADQRRFSAHCSNDDTVVSNFVTTADSFEEAALRFAERWSGAEEMCRVIVVDTDTGEQHCFTIEVGQGLAEPC